MRLRQAIAVAVLAASSAVSSSRLLALQPSVPGQPDLDLGRPSTATRSSAAADVPGPSNLPSHQPALRSAADLPGSPSLGGTTQAARGASGDVPAANITLLLVIGAAGEPKYGRAFQSEAEAWRKAARAAGGVVVAIGDDEGAPAGTIDRDRLAAALAAEPKTGFAELWVVLIGHGTYDGTDAKFNLRGPDVTAVELAGWLKPFRRPVAIIDTSSASAPFLTALSAPGRVIVTATRSGFEQNYTRLGEFLAATLTDPAADLDKDGQVSLLEAFLLASRRTAEFYQTQGRLATEHPLLDDNGDGLGTPADWFKGVRATKRARDGAELDGLRARQLCLVRSAAEEALAPDLRARRDALEREVEQLRAAKPTLPEQAYFDRLEKLMLELAAIYDGT